MKKAVANKGFVEKLARFGYLAHGLIYIMIGGLAAQFAIGAGGTLTDPPGALEMIRDLPLGKQAVLLTAIGLAAYALWRLIQAATDPDRQGTGPKGLAVRVGRGISAVGYAVLAILALKLFAGTADGRNIGLKQAAQVLTEPVGSVLGTLTAVIVFGVALEDLRKACTARFGERMKSSNMTMLERRWSRSAGRCGFAARAIVLSFAGAFLLRASWYGNPGEVKGFAGVLASILALPYGNWVLGGVGLGLAAYGCFMIMAGRYRHHPC
jgi:hypothetical protein